MSGNFADSWGGGINSYNGTLIVQRSTISGNRAGYGGGIYSSTSSNFAPTKTVVANSTISGNSISSANGAGGGIYNDYGLTEINNTTITNNTAPVGGGVYSRDSSYVSTRFFSTIYAGNSGDLGSMRSIVSGGYNLMGSCCIGSVFNKPGDRIGVGPNHGLGPLANNGGPTLTHALQPGSPAINTGPPTTGGITCPPPATDQRGVKRPQGGRCDKGSFEVRP